MGKTQYLVTVTVDVPFGRKEDERSILRKVCESVVQATGYIVWEVECQEIKEYESNVL